MCDFFCIWLEIISVLKNSLSSDRDGIWDLHVASLEDKLPIYAEYDCPLYLRSTSFYFEQMKTLEITHPYLFRNFKLGMWVVQENPGKFRAVGGDMKNEQSLQKVSKGPAGHYVVGQTRKPAAVAEFELLFHEIGEISSLLGFLTTDEGAKHLECNLQVLTVSV